MLRLVAFLRRRGAFAGVRMAVQGKNIAHSVCAYWMQSNGRPRRKPGAVMIADPERNTMPRAILAESQIHHAVREKIANSRTELEKEVKMAGERKAIDVDGEVTQRQ